MDTQVYCGFWINWSFGAVQGATLTVPLDYGKAIVAAIALVIAFTTTQLWGIASFATHQLRAAACVADDVHHQVQVSLRNTATPYELLLQLARIAWSRRQEDSDGRGRGEGHGSAWLTLTRLLPLVAAGFAGIIMSSAAGLLAPGQFTASDEVLVRSRTCGWELGVVVPQGFSPEDVGLADEVTALLLRGRIAQKNAVKYARECYGQIDRKDAVCSTFAASRIDTAVSEVDCPFAEGACKGRGIEIDSALFDSNNMLGINTPVTQRVLARKVITCAPLDGERYASEWAAAPPDHDLLPGDVIKTYSFGPWVGGTDWTFMVSNYTGPGSSIPPYSLQVRAHRAGNTSTFMEIFPISDLVTTDADLTILGMRGVTVFGDPVSDPWFNASTRQPWGQNSTIWKTDNGLSFIACTEQYQFCAGDSCSPLAGLYQINPATKSSLFLDFNPTQRAIIELMWKAMESAQVMYSFLSLGADILLANDLVLSPDYMRSPTLPENQWVSEVHNVANVSLALIQGRIVDYAYPALNSPPHIGSGFVSTPGIALPENEEARYLCSQIKIRRKDYTSFRVIALGALASLALAIMLINSRLAAIVGWTRSWRMERYRSVPNPGRRKQWQWEACGNMQLLRLACEGNGIGPWIGMEAEAPRTAIRGLKFSLDGDILE